MKARIGCCSSHGVASTTPGLWGDGLFSKVGTTYDSAQIIISHLFAIDAIIVTA